MDISYAPIIITGEFVSLAVMLVVLYGLLFENRSHGQRQVYFMWTIVAVIASLLCDSFCRIIDGMQGILWLQKILNCGSLIGGAVIVSIFGYYEIEAIREKGVKISYWFAHGMAIANGLAALATIIGTALGFTFTVVDNVFLEGPLYRLCTYLVIISMVYSLVLSIVYRKALGKHDSVAFFIYLAFPIVTAMVQMFPPYLELAYITTAIAALIVYIMLQSGHISELNMREQLMEEFSFTDTLTGLRNRRAFDSILADIFSWESVGVIFGDLNGLKFINDNLGHKAGDERLQKCSNIFLRFFPQDSVFRISGDEFVIFQKNPDAEFHIKANTLHKALMMERDIASIGMAEGPGSDVMSLINKAENAMYAEKASAAARHPEYKRKQSELLK